MPEGRQNGSGEYDPAEIQFGAPDRRAPGAQNTPDAAPPTDPERDPAVLRERWLRAAAELDNVRKRTADQIRRDTTRERKAMLQGFLDVADSLEQALASHRGEENEWVRGTRAILQQLNEVLGRFGARPFNALGTLFDPERHEAAARVLASPDLADGTIVEVLRTGYEFEDGSLLRPARAIVAQSEREPAA
jgi:molecular chaperone GrpE